jgi:transcriptional regulator with XRE-family HTH domain
MTFPERLDQICTERGISQKWIAEHADVTEASVSRWIGQNSYPAVVDAIKRLAVDLNVTADYLIGLTDIPTPSQSLSSDTILLIRCYDRMNAEDKFVLWALLDRYIAPIDRQQNPVFHT